MINRPAHVLLVEASGRGFLNHYSHALAQGLHLCGVKVQLMMGHRDELSDWEVPYHKLACIKKGRSRWRCVRKFVTSEKPDIVHLQWIDNPVAMLRLVRWLKKMGIRVVYTPHNILPHEKRWLLMPLYRLLYRHMDKIVARDTHLAWALEELLDIPKENIVYLPGSPNLLAHNKPTSARVSPAPARIGGETRLLFFGHGCTRKGLDLLLKTISENDWPQHIHLVVAGERVLRGIPPELIARVQGKMRLTLIDSYVAASQVAHLFTDADVLLMPYVKLCKSPLLDLAAALKLPVLRSDRVQGADFREGIHGVTFPHEEHDVMVRLLMRMDWARKIRRNLETFDSAAASMERLAKGHSELYRNLLNEEARVTEKSPLIKLSVST